ncbi:hypothetical protein LQW54_002484 [Pestalotiopsis sp. IQ-011]
MAQSQIPADTVERPETTVLMNKTAFEDAETSQLQRQRRLRMSKTWSSSSADINLISKEEEVLDVRPFVMEYNQLAKKYGIRPLIPGDFPMKSPVTSQQEKQLDVEGSASRNGAPSRTTDDGQVEPHLAASKNH